MRSVKNLTLNANMRFCLSKRSSIDWDWIRRGCVARRQWSMTCLTIWKVITAEWSCVSLDFIHQVFTFTGTGAWCNAIGWVSKVISEEYAAVSLQRLAKGIYITQILMRLLNTNCMSINFIHQVLTSIETTDGIISVWCIQCSQSNCTNTSCGIDHAHS